MSTRKYNMLSVRTRVLLAAAGERRRAASFFLSLLEAADKAKVMSVSSWLASISGKKTGGNYGYCASKTTLNMLARAMAFDLVPKGIKSVVVNPGWVSTDMGVPKAKLTPHDSVAALLDVAGKLTLDDAGRFIQWDRSEHDW